ncbi:MAG TPA: glycosyltransferase [Thermoanaerobaculia bacterium]|jgi:undecaprenyl-phosphate 4-deoxy-4-formamido-L-arabinose transferase
MDPYLSVVIPVYNEEANLPELLERVTATLAALGRPYEVVMVNDGSRDRSLPLLREAATRDPHLVVVDFNRNYGQHAAIFAGFEVSRGEVVVTLDADLQNPPEEIPKLVAKVEEGFDVVGSIRVHRQDTLLRRVASKIVNRMTAIATGVQLSDYGCMLRAYSRPVVKLLASSREISTFIPVLADLYAGRVTEIPVAHSERRHGESKYSLWSLFRLQFDLMTSFSVLPLRATMGIGVVMAIASFLVALVLGAGRLIWGQQWAVSGVFTLFALVFFFLGVQLFAIGLLGEYVGRIYQEVRDRPRYVIRQVIRGSELTR